MYSLVPSSELTQNVYIPVVGVSTAPKYWMENTSRY